MEGGPQRGRWLPGGGVPLDDGSCGGGGLGSAKRRDGHKHWPGLRPRSFPASRVDPPAPVEWVKDRNCPGRHQWRHSPAFRGGRATTMAGNALMTARRPFSKYQTSHMWRSPKRQRTVGLATRPPSSMSFLGVGQNNNGTPSPTCSSTPHTATPAHADIERDVRLPA